MRLFIRVEFQDGTRKAPTQDYHGSGRPHVHVLVFASQAALQAMSLTESVSATMPKPLEEGGPDAGEEEDVLPGAVQGSQLDRRGNSGWKVQTEANHRDPETGSLKLLHTEDDSSNGLRAYFPAIMEALRCHQDFQICDDDQLMLAYLAKYAAKFSDSNQDEWLNDAAEANSMSATVLCRYHPNAPEMTAQLTGAQFRQWHFTTESGGKRDFIVPWPEKLDMPPEVKQYTQTKWAAGKISLLDFLRKTDDSGNIHAWLKKKHKESKSSKSLGAFAPEYVMAGEKVVAADMLSRYNDRFYGQWLMLNVPFKSPKDFIRPVKSQLALVPAEHRNFAMALLCEHAVARATWHNAEALKKELRVEGHSQKFANTLLGMWEASSLLIEKYVTGQADAKKEAQERKEAIERRSASDPSPGFNREQRRLQEEVAAAVDRAQAALAARDEAEADRLVEEAHTEGKIFVCTGGPGTGKTTVALACVRHASEEGGKVLFVYPTNRQASRMRAQLPPEVEVNTYHAGFGLDEEPGNVAICLARYSLIVVDEISQLQGKHFDHIRKLWDQADRLPVILMAGDEMQISGYGEERAWKHPMWKRTTYRIKLHEVYRCKDKQFNKVLQELRTSRPKKETLKWLTSRKAWAPPGKPTARTVRKLLKTHRKTVILTCTRRGAHTINALALEALFPKYAPLVTVDADIESNPENWEGKELKSVGDLVSTRLPIYKGAKICFTRNIRKDIDYVNGMDAEVVAYHKDSQAVEVITQTGHRVMVWKWTDPDLGGLTYYPIKAGYADTIMKYQGAELEHVTVYLDASGVPGAAYTALSRVSYGKDFLIGGIVRAEHFQPVDES